MKKAIKRLAIVCALVCVLAVSAFAADFTHCADALKDLGLFNGTAKGYELDRAPTRAEAATMLVRLLGQEKAAQALTYTAPFTDLPDWVKPYVQYLYDNGLTSGKTETTFAPSEKCTAQMYATFLMRALGYSDKDGDFTYAGAIQFAKDKAVINAYNCDEKAFLRDHVVAMSYTALATQTADSDADLLQQLLKAGVITDAKGYDAQFRAYRDYVKEMTAAAANKDAAKSHMKMDMTMDAKVAGVEFLSGTMTMDIMAELNMTKLDSSKFAMTGKMDTKLNPTMFPTDNVMSETTESYFTDGYLYTKVGDTKIKQAMSFDAMLAQMGASMNTSAEPLCMIQNISLKDGVYSVSYAGTSFGSLMDTAMSAAGQMTGAAGDMKVDITKFDMRVTVKNGKLTTQFMDMGMSMTIEGQTMDMALQMTMTDVGGTVNVVLPTDLNTYISADALIAEG